MKKLTALSLILAFAVILPSCNKDAIEKQSNEKMNEKKENLSQEKNTTDNKVSSVKSSGNVKLYTLESVEKSAGKNTAPDFTWTADGKKVSLKGMKGNVVLVNLWATWCKPCIKEMPDLSLISEELKDKNFQMIGVNIFQQEGSKTVSDFLKTNPVAYTILDGNQQIVDAFGEATGNTIQAVPTTFIIDKNGKIAETIVGGRSKEAFLGIINKYLN